MAVHILFLHYVMLNNRAIRFDFDKNFVEIIVVRVDHVKILKFLINFSKSNDAILLSDLEGY